MAPKDDPETNRVNLEINRVQVELPFHRHPTCARRAFVGQLRWKTRCSPSETHSAWVHTSVPSPKRPKLVHWMPRRKPRGTSSCIERTSDKDSTRCVAQVRCRSQPRSPKPPCMRSGEAVNLRRWKTSRRRGKRTRTDGRFLVGWTRSCWTRSATMRPPPCWQ